MQTTIRINPNSPRNHHGPGARSRARADARTHGAGGHLRADGSFRLYWRDPESGRIRQRTWSRFGFSAAVACINPSRR